MARVCLWAGLAVHLLSAQAAWVPETTLSGRIGVEGRGHFHAAPFDGQSRHGTGVTLRGDWRASWDGGLSFRAAPLLQWDSSFDETLRWEPQELHLALEEDQWRVRLGYTRVFWGASDVFRIIDIINQRDRLDLLDQSEKLGQPMLEIVLRPGVGVLEFYAMPYFREMPFPGRRGRLRPPLPVDTDHVLYETGSPGNTADLALRFIASSGPVDWGVHVFRGRNRTPFLVHAHQIPEPLRVPGREAGNVLIPVYEDVRQAGLEVQWAAGAWLWKLEGAHRSGFFDRYVVAAGGMERTFSAIAHTRADLSILIEYAYDQRGKKPETPTLFDNDLFAGFRLAGGGPLEASVRGGMLWDLDHRETLATLQVERRVGAAMRLRADAWLVIYSPPASTIHAYRNEDFLRLQWLWDF